MYVKVNDDLICIDKLIKAEFISAPYNKNSILKLTYTVNDVNIKEPYTVSEFSNISKDCIQILSEAIQNDKKFVDISKSA